MAFPLISTYKRLWTPALPLQLTVAKGPASTADMRDFIRLVRLAETSLDLIV